LFSGYHAWRHLIEKFGKLLLSSQKYRQHLDA